MCLYSVARAAVADLENALSELVGEIPRAGPSGGLSEQGERRAAQEAELPARHIRLSAAEGLRADSTILTVHHHLQGSGGKAVDVHTADQPKLPLFLAHCT